VSPVDIRSLVKTASRDVDRERVADGDTGEELDQGDGQPDLD
jgi:hypothetical protein